MTDREMVPVWNSTLKVDRNYRMPRSPMKRGSRRIKSKGRRWLRRKAAGEVESPLWKWLGKLAKQRGSGCHSCGKGTDTLRRDHVMKRGMGGAIGDYLPNGDGNLWLLCHECDEFKEANSQHALDEKYPDRPTGRETARSIASAYERNHPKTREQR